ncbi:MAG: hypothetical protein IJI05_02295 [Erysipelotrichaceae bacterium]|nr:hypothetical protein [Erysipelotrichaceae bacterium]
MAEETKKKTTAKVGDETKTKQMKTVKTTVKKKTGKTTTAKKTTSASKKPVSSKTTKMKTTSVRKPEKTEWPKVEEPAIREVSSTVTTDEPVKDVISAVEETVQELSSIGDKVTEKATETVEKTEEKIEETAAAITEKAAEIVEKAEDKTAEAVETVRDDLRETVEKTEEKVSEAVEEKIPEEPEKAKKSFKDYFSGLFGKKDKPAEEPTAEDKPQDVIEQPEEAIREVTEKAEKETKLVESEVREGAGKAAEILTEAEEKVENVPQEIAEKAEEITAETGEKTLAETEKTKKSLKDIFAGLFGKKDQTGEEVKEETASALDADQKTDAKSSEEETKPAEEENKKEDVKKARKEARKAAAAKKKEQQEREKKEQQEREAALLAEQEEQTEMAEKSGKKKKKSEKLGFNWFFWISFVVLMVPVCYFGYLLYQASQETNTPVIGDRIKTDIETEITEEALSSIKTQVLSLEGVEKCEVNLIVETMRVNVDTVDDMTDDKILELNKAIYNIVDAQIPVEEYFTSRFSYKGYDLEITSYTNLDSDDCAIVMLTKNSRMEQYSNQVVSKPKNPEVATELHKLAEEQKIEYEEYKNNQGREDEPTDFTNAPAKGRRITPKDA